VIYDNSDFYKKAIKKYGVSAQGVHWKNEDTQYKRFEALTYFIENEIQKSSIVDAGCGFGEYYNYLRQNKTIPKSYIGLDCEKAMVKKAVKRFKGIEFFQKDILCDTLPKSDYYVCSGALNILEIDEVEIFLQRMYEHSYKGVVFNSLNGFTFNKVNKKDIVQIVQKISTRFTLKEDYLENDFTIFINKI
jgi:SAM-dependent methyltransferase